VLDAVIGNAGTLIVFRVGNEDAALLAPEFAVGTLDAGLMLAPENRPVVAGDLAAQEPFTTWLRRGIDRDRIFVEPRLYSSRGSAEAIGEQSRQRFYFLFCQRSKETAAASRTSQQQCLFARARFPQNERRGGTRGYRLCEDCDRLNKLGR
jgi:hypothetical protein